MNRRKKQLTEKEQRVAAEILCDYIVSHNGNGYQDEFAERVMKQYGLYNDPFTKLPCTPKEYCKNSLEYDRQTMIERFGHCDGLCEE